MLPKTYRENLEARHQILERARYDKAYREEVRELFFRDPIFAFNAFFFTLDVRRRPQHHQPFCTYPYQDLAILDITNAILNKEDLVIEKSRDMGCSWLVLMCYFWIWLNPQGGADFLLGSRIEDYVDKRGDMRTLMQKIRYALYRLPVWLRPKGFSPKKHDNFMKLENPESGATITGESNNPNFSTGGRYLSVFYDEFAKWESTDEQAWTAGGDATPSRIAVSTPFGAAGKYYDLVTDGKTKKLTLHWSLHPLKNPGLACVWPKHDDADEFIDEKHYVGLTSDWYEAQILRREAKEVAQELDIDYIGAGNPVFRGRAGRRLLQLMRIEKPLAAAFSIDLDSRKLQSLPLELASSREGYFLVYEMPTSTSQEATGVDVVEGKEDGDYAVIKVVNRATKSLVASYYSQVDEVELAKVLCAIDKWYSSFKKPNSDYSNWIGIETIGPGLSTFDFCVEWGVENLFMMPNYDSATGSTNYTKGFRTNGSSRKKLVSAVAEWLIERRGWCDIRCCREMTAFVYSKTGKPQAKSGAHDDEVMALGIALMVDLLMPSVEEKIPVATLPDALAQVPESMFSRFPARREPTVDEICLAQIAAKKNNVSALEAEFLQDMAHSPWKCASCTIERL